MMNLPETLTNLQYSPEQQATIKHCLRSLSYIHRAELYHVFAQQPAMARPFFDLLLSSAHAYNSADPNQAEELATQYKQTYNTLSS